jgi:hypothetical protein
VRVVAEVPLEIVDGAPVLPEILLWALSLKEGDLLIASPSRGTEPMDWKFASYLDRVSSIVVGCRPVWLCLEKYVFHESLGAVGRGGALILPDEAAALVRPGGSIYLKAEDRSQSFTLISGRPRPSFHAEARYKLTFEPDLRVTLPAEALWALRLSPGDRLTGQAFFAEVELGPPSRRLSDGKKIELELEPGGALQLPESLRILIEGKARANALLIACVSAQPSFRITQWVDLSGDGEE